MMRDETVVAHYNKNYKKLVKHAIYRVPNRAEHLAEEVVQEAYAKALKFFKAYDPERNKFEPWFNRIFNGCVSDCIKAEGGSHPSFDDEDNNLEPFIIDNNQWIPKDMVIKIKEGIDAQRPEAAEVLRMFFILGMETPDIASCTNLTHTNVRQIIYRFRIGWSDENIF